MEKQHVYAKFSDDDVITAVKEFNKVLGLQPPIQVEGRSSHLLKVALRVYGKQLLPLNRQGHWFTPKTFAVLAKSGALPQRSEITS